MAGFSRTTTMTSTNWADDVEEDEAELERVQSMQGVASPRAAQPTSPIAHGGPPAYDEARGGHGYGGGPLMDVGPPLPDRPPFKAYLGNIPYDLDEEVVADFFRGLQIVDIIITRHHDTGKPKGCFVEFGSKEDLGKALTADGEPMMRRPVRIQVAEPPRRDGFADRRGGFGRRDEGYGRRDDGYGRRDEGFGGRRGGGGFADRYNEGRDRDWPQRRGPPGDDQPTSPRERPKLVLQPRSQPAEAASAGASDGAPAAAPAPRSNPFGSAKPVDTVAKLKEIEDRQKQRKAEEEAAKKKAKEAAAAAAAEREKEGAAVTSPKAPPPPPASAKPAAAASGPPPPPGIAAPAAAAAAHGTEGGAGRGRGGPARTVVTVPRPAGRGTEGGRGAGRGEGRGAGRGRGEHHAGGRGDNRAGRAGERAPAGGRGGRGEGGRGGRGGRGGSHHDERPAKDHKGIDHLRAKGYVLDEDEVPKTKVENPFDLLNLADE